MAGLCCRLIACQQTAVSLCGVVALVQSLPLRVSSWNGWASQGPLQDMGEVELRHWLRTAAARAAFAAAAQADALLDAFAGKPQALQGSFQVGCGPNLVVLRAHGEGSLFNNIFEVMSAPKWSVLITWNEAQTSTCSLGFSYFCPNQLA